MISEFMERRWLIALFLIVAGLVVNIVSVMILTRHAHGQGIHAAALAVEQKTNTPPAGRTDVNMEPSAGKQEDIRHAEDSVDDAISNVMEAMIVEKYIPVDLAGITDVNEKVKKIYDAFLEYIKNKKKGGMINSDQYINQMAELGPAAAPALLKMFEESLKTGEEDEFSEEDIEKQLFLKEALARLLTEQNKDEILRYFDEYGIFAPQVAKYRFPEADAMVLKKIAEGASGKMVGMMRAEEDVKALIDLGLTLDENAVVPMLIAQLKEGYILEAAVERLAAMPDLNLQETLVTAAANTQSEWDRTTLLKPMLERGMSEGLDLALTLLKSDSEYARKHVRELLPNYTGSLGTAEELTAWLEINRAFLAWNSKTRRYEMR